LAAAPGAAGQALRSGCGLAPGANGIEAGFGLRGVLVEAGKSRATVVGAGGAVIELARDGALPNLAHGAVADVSAVAGAANAVDLLRLEFVAVRLGPFGGGLCAQGVVVGPRRNQGRARFAVYSAVTE